MHYLLSQKQSEVAALCRSAGVRRLDVFGSAVRDDFDSARSDLDFLVEFEEAAPVAYAQSLFYAEIWIGGPVLPSSGFAYS